jgi:hypothetical protein
MARLADPWDPKEKKYPFQYTNAANTDVRKTFKEARRRMLEEVKAPSAVRAINEKRRA